MPSQCDVGVVNHGTLVGLTPNTEAAKEWFASHLPDDAPRLGKAVYVEPRYADSIIEGMQGDGLTIGPEPVTSWMAEVIADSSGQWAGNGLRFETQEEAKSY